jgi:uncharacterized membrane protein
MLLQPVSILLVFAVTKNVIQLTMKLFGHPVHLMLIHFPAALFPMELVSYFIFYKTGNASFGTASFYAAFAGALLGWAAIITGATDLVMIKNNSALQAKALVHGTINSIVVITYSVIAFKLYKDYPATALPTVTLLIVKAVVNVLMIVGNYLGATLVLKYKMGVHS